MNNNIDLSYVEGLTGCLIINQVPLVTSLNLILPVYEMLDDDNKYEYLRWLTIYNNNSDN